MTQSTVLPNLLSQSSRGAEDSSQWLGRGMGRQLKAEALPRPLWDCTSATLPLHFKKNVYLFLRERERDRDRVSGEEPEKEGDTGSEAGSRL